MATVSTDTLADTSIFLCEQITRILRRYRRSTNTCLLLMTSSVIPFS